MNKMIEYGILCSSKDEKKLMNELFAFLAPLNRTFSKTSNKGMLDARLPYVYKHFYWNLNKEKQVYVELYPNIDMEGKSKFQREDIGWVMFANLKDQSPPYHVPLEEQEQYIRDMLSSLTFESTKLYEYAEGEERI